MARLQDAGDDGLDGGAAGGAVAAADLAGDDGRADGLLSLPVGGFDLGVAQEGEDGLALGAQVLEELAVGRVGRLPGEVAIETGLQPPDVDGAAAGRGKVGLPVVTQGQGVAQETAEGVGQPGRASLGGLEQEGQRRMRWPRQVWWTAATKRR